MLSRCKRPHAGTSLLRACERLPTRDEEDQLHLHGGEPIPILHGPSCCQVQTAPSSIASEARAGASLGAGKRHEEVLPAGRAPDSGEAVSQDATFEILAEGLLDEGRNRFDGSIIAPS